MRGRGEATQDHKGYQMFEEHRAGGAGTFERAKRPRGLLAFYSQRRDSRITVVSFKQTTEHRGHTQVQ
jgi:hypothetical protein